MTLAVNRIFKAVEDVLQVVEVNDFINHIYNYRDNYKKSNLQDLVIKKIISETCESVGIPENDVLRTKFNHQGKRVMALGLIGMQIKSCFPQLSFQRICVELNNNVNVSNLQRYVKIYKDFKPNTKNKQDIATAKMIDTLNYKILNYIRNEKLRTEKEV